MWLKTSVLKNWTYFYNQQMNFGIKSVNKVFSELLQLTLQCVFSGTSGSPCLLTPLLLTDIAAQWKEGGFC